MLGQSIPIAAPASTIVGIIAGELAGYVAKEFGANETIQRIALGSAHAIASAATGYAINTVLGADAPGAVVTTVQSPTSALLHVMAKSHSPLQLPNFENWK